MMFFPIVSALFASSAMLALASAVFSLPLSATAPLAVPLALLGAMAFIPFALALVAAVIVFKQAASGTQFVVSGIAIVGGLYFPVALLPAGSDGRVTCSRLARQLIFCVTCWSALRFMIRWLSTC